MSPVDFAAAGLLDGLEGKERQARKQLLASLAKDGFSLEELQRAVAEDRLTLLPLERILGGTYTAADVQRQTGLDAALVMRMRRLLGLPEARPEDRVFSVHDIDTAKALGVALEAGIPLEAIEEVNRVVGESMARVAATTAAAFARAYMSPGDSERDVALRFARFAERLAPNLDPALVAAYHAHLRDTVRRAVIGASERERGSPPDEQALTVCFADMVGFTRLGAELEAQELGSVAGRLAALANDVTQEPVRLVKTIGDAAMFVSSEPSAVVRVGLALIEAVEAEELPAVRAGAAIGPTLLRGGDYYGHGVNLASRVTGAARPGSVLCTEEIYEAASDQFMWSFAGRHRLKGVDDQMALYRARPLPDEDAAADEPAAHPGSDHERPRERKASRRRRPPRRR
ncbi:MAG TPA: adenylate cyclase regulatory domain-containing protein [Solirubrobacteraceae bacterium]